MLLIEHQEISRIPQNPTMPSLIKPQATFCAIPIKTRANKVGAHNFNKYGLWYLSNYLAGGFNHLEKWWSYMEFINGTDYPIYFRTWTHLDLGHRLYRRHVQPWPCRWLPGKPRPRVCPGPGSVGSWIDRIHPINSWWFHGDLVGDSCWLIFG